MSSRTRLRPEARREQLLDLGGQLLAARTLDELTIDLLAEEAGVSRGLLYHYFGSLQEFHRAVIGRAVGELVAATAPVEGGAPLERLTGSLRSYIDYVADNYAGYRSLVQAAHGGDAVLKSLYDQARAQLLDRIFELADHQAMAELGLADTPGVRLVVLAWSTMVESMVMGWVEDPRGLSRDQLVASMVGALPAALAGVRPTGGS